MKMVNHFYFYKYIKPKIKYKELNRNYYINYNLKKQQRGF